MIAGSVGHRRAGAAVRANMTPMIDVVFLLIIFFMLVAQISRQRAIEIDLPRLENAASTSIEGESRAVVNVVPRDRVAAFEGDYRMGAMSYDNTPDGLRLLAAALRDAAAANPDVEVLVRAARTEKYERVYPVLRAVRDAGIARVSLVTLREQAG
jgi:biopolymer transport protein ExbD